MIGKYYMKPMYRQLVCTWVLALAIGYGLPAMAKPVTPPPPFPAWLESLKAEATAKGVGKATLEQALGGVKPIPRVIELDRRQPEFTLTLGGYFKKAISAKRIATGKEMLKKHETLSNLHKQNLEKKRKKEEAERAALAAGLAGGEKKEGDAA